MCQPRQQRGRGVERIRNGNPPTGRIEIFDQLLDLPCQAEEIGVGTGYSVRDSDNLAPGAEHAWNMRQGVMDEKHQNVLRETAERNATFTPSSKAGHWAATTWTPWHGDSTSPCKS
jgi:hypothetical protein